MRHCSETGPSGDRAIDQRLMLPRKMELFLSALPGPQQGWDIKAGNPGTSELTFVPVLTNLFLDEMLQLPRPRFSHIKARSLD